MSLSSRLAKTLAGLLGENAAADFLLRWAEGQQREQEIIDLCAKAMRRARFDPLQQPLTLTDIGLIAYRIPQTARLIHTAPVATDHRWLRPFAEVESPKHQYATLQLSILDPQGKVLFTETQNFNFRRGKTRVVTRTWLPLEKLRGALTGRWSVVVYLNGVLMAIHPFEWAAVGANDDILNLMVEDGEINEELQRELRHGKFRKMSLDELLSEQED